MGLGFNECEDNKRVGELGVRIIEKIEYEQMCLGNHCIGRELAKYKV